MASLSVSPQGAPARLVILGCGYLGAALARAALARGWAVSALTRNPERAEELRALGLETVVVADLAGEAWHDALDSAGAAVVNCVSPAGAGPEGYRHSFGEGSRSLARWLERAAAADRPRARAVVFTSATTVYPQTDGEWVDEETPVEPAALGAAGAALHAAEEAMLGLAPALAARAWVLRLGGIYGPHRHHLLDALRGGQRVFPGRGDYWVNLIHRDDAVAAVLACLDAPPSHPGGVYNVVDGQPVRKAELLAGLAELLGLATGSVRCDAEAPPARAPHRQTGAGGVPHRRVANARLRHLGWRPEYSTFRDGFRALPGAEPEGGGGR